MNIEMKTGLAGVDFAWSVGDVLTVGVDVDSAEAGRWVAAAYAEQTDKPRGRRSPAGDHTGIETAEASTSGVETAEGKRLFGAAAAAYLRKLTGRGK